MAEKSTNLVVERVVYPSGSSFETEYLLDPINFWYE